LDAEAAATWEEAHAFAREQLDAVEADLRALCK
jgi:hypothetical protein